MADKLLKYDVAMKSTKTVWQMETPRCYTGDENTVTFDFNITDLEAADLVGVIPNVYLYMRDGSFFQNGPADGVEITGTTVNYTMKGNEGKHSGIAKAQLVLVWDDEVNPPEKLTSQMYAFEVVSGLENKVAVEVMIQDWTTLTREARTFIDTSADEVDALKGELQTAITTANTSLGEFDVALQNGIVATNIAAELQNLEETYAPDLFTVKKRLEQANTQIKTKTKWELEHAFLGLLKKYNMPDPDFNVFPIKILTDGYQFRYFFDITAFKNTGGTTYYISPTGSDANDGLTEGTARKIFASVPFVAGDTVILLDGIYPRTIWTNDTQIEKSVNIIAKNPGKVIVKNGNDHTYALYSTYTKTYFTARSNVAKAVQIIGDETTELVKVLDIASVEATEGTWYNDGVNTYIHMFYDAVPTNANLALTLLTRKALIHTLCTTSNVIMYVEGIKFIGGNPATVLFSASATYRAPKFYANKCQFLHAYDAAQARDAVSILGATAYFVECEASFSNKDGFNYHQFDGTIAYGLEIDCIAKANGYGNTGGAYNNGSTAHDGSKVIRIGGTYFSNYGANVADVHVNTKSLNIECNAFNSTAGTGDGSDADFAAQQTGTTMWLLSCRGLGSKYNLYCAAGATMYVQDSDYTTKNLSGNIVDVA